jgi:AbrB family looped-hinge helix DNA binding protein
MRTTIDKAGRVVIPASVRAKVGLRPGTALEVLVEEGSIRLVRAVPRPTADSRALPPVDIARLVEEERSRWPH